MSQVVETNEFAFILAVKATDDRIQMHLLKFQISLDYASIGPGLGSNYCLHVLSFFVML